MTKVGATDTAHQPGATETLARFTSGAGRSDLPPAVLVEARRAFVNGMGCILGGAHHDLVDRAHRALAPGFGAPVARLVGRGVDTDPFNAALLNGLAGAAYSFDDAYSDQLLHPTGPVLAALLSLVGSQPVNGSDFITALAIGMETVCRLTRLVSASQDAGQLAWSQTGIAGGTGAAVAASRLMGLDADATVWAIGLALSEAAGTRATHGSMAASMIFGHAAQSGLRAAHLARAGFTATAAAIESRHGFAAVHASGAGLAEFMSGLVPDQPGGIGSAFEMLSISYKPYPCAVLIHPALEGVLRLCRTGGVSGDAITGIRLQVSPDTVTLTDRPDPRNEMEAKLSLQHWLAAGAVHGQAALREGSQECIDAPQVARLRGLVQMTADPAIANEAAVVTLDLLGGERLEVRVDPCIGSPSRPMPDADLDAKFMAQALPGRSHQQAADLLALCREVEALPDMTRITSAT